MSTIDLKGCVRISDILKWIKPYENVDLEVLKAKGKIGTDVHKAILADCSGDFYCTCTDRAQAYFDSYKLQYPEVPNIQQVPRLYCFDYMITGECDGLLDGSLIDWKCSANAFPDLWNMQAHFYWYLLTQNGYQISDNMTWVNLRHNKRKIKDHTTGVISGLEYTPIIPISYKFTFDQKVLDKCLEASIMYWEALSSAKCVV